MLSGFACDDGAPALTADAAGTIDQGLFDVAADTAVLDAQPDTALIDAGRADAEQPDAEQAALLDASQVDAEQADAARDALLDAADAEPADAADAEAADVADAEPADAEHADVADFGIFDGSADDRPLPDAEPDAAEPAPLTAYCNPQEGSVGLVLEGAATAAEVVLLDAADAPVLLADGRQAFALAPADWRVDGDVVWFSARVAADVGAVAALEVALPEAVLVAPCRPPAPAEGVCDPPAALDVCPPGQRCPDGACVPATAPVLDRATVRSVVHTRALGVALRGDDTEGDLVAVVVALLDAQGQPLRARDGALIPPLVAPVEAEPGAFDVRATGQLAAALGDPGRAVLARVHALDATGLESAPLEVRVDPPVDAPPDAPCDLTEVFVACPDDQVCGPAAGDPLAPGRCQTPVRFCPEAYGAQGVGPGRTELAAAPLSLSASCPTGPRQAVAAFTAPRAGHWRFDAAGGLFARTHCSLPQPRFELACGAPIDLQLGAGQTVWLVVTGDAERLDLDIQGDD